MAPVFIMLGLSITNKYRQKYYFNDALSDLHIQRNVRMSDETFLWYYSGEKALKKTLKSKRTNFCKRKLISVIKRRFVQNNSVKVSSVRDMAQDRDCFGFVWKGTLLRTSEAFKERGPLLKSFYQFISLDFLMSQTIKVTKVAIDCTLAQRESKGQYNSSRPEWVRP